MLRTQSARPHPALQPFIFSFVQRDAELGSLEVVEPVVARLGVSVNFKFAGSYRIRSYAANSMVRPNRISVVGPQTYRRVRISLSGAIDNVAVMFQPCGFHALFGIPTNFLADRTTEGHALLGMTISELYEQLGGLRNFSEREKLLNRYFLQCLGNAEAISPVYDSLHQLTVQRYLSIADVARQAGLSRRQLERKSLLYAGITPKTLTRIARFNSALQLGREGLFNWTEVAHMNEYHDHMHLIRDFRAFAGQVPSLTQRQITPDHLINFSPSGFGSTFPAYGRQQFDKRPAS